MKIKYQLVETTKEYKSVFITRKDLGYLYEKYNSLKVFENRILYPYNKKDFIEHLLSIENFKKINDSKLKGRIIATILNKRILLGQISKVYIQDLKNKEFIISLTNNKNQLINYYYIY